MSRSLKHTPICGVTTARSEHWSKRRWNRVFRRRTQAALARGLEVLPLNIHKETEVWDGEKDGRMRFDPQTQPRLLRK